MGCPGRHAPPTSPTCTARPCPSRSVLSPCDGRPALAKPEAAGLFPTAPLRPASLGDRHLTFPRPVPSGAGLAVTGLSWLVPLSRDFCSNLYSLETTNPTVSARSVRSTCTQGPAGVRF